MKLSILAATLLFALATTACSSGDTTATNGDGGTDGGGDAGDPPPIHASDYNTHCNVIQDCSLVDDGDVCGCSECGNAAINSGDLAKYQADVAAKKMLCPNGGMMACPASCIYSELSCMGNVCGVCHTTGCASPDAGDDASSDAAHE